MLRHFNVIRERRHHPSLSAKMQRSCFETHLDDQTDRQHLTEERNRPPLPSDSWSWAFRCLAVTKRPALMELCHFERACSFFPISLFLHPRSGLGRVT